MRILVVDDSIHVQRQLRIFLGGGGHQDLLFASSAAEAFALLRLDTDDTQPAADLILMDIEMEGMGGIEATRRLKADPRYREAPVIMVTGDSTSESLEASFAAGAVDYITKPIRKAELLARVRSFLRLWEEIVIRKKREAELVLLSEELGRVNEVLRSLAARDGLTGVYNRRTFDETLAREWKVSARRQIPLALLMLDVDFFKLYNDHYGHVEGDRCLREVAAAMLETVKRPSDLVARYGGEEFAVILPETGERGAEKVAKLLLEAVSRRRLPHARSAAGEWVTVSIGVAAMVATGEEGPEILVRASDRALYLAKHEGRNRWRMARD